MHAGFEHDVFLSYSAKDKSKVRRLAEKLQANGLRVWVDMWSLSAGEDIFLESKRAWKNHGRWYLL